MARVIDVSSYQGEIDWSAVAGDVDGAIVKLGYGSDYANQDDGYAAENIAGCERNGIPMGCYLYSYATDAAQAASELRHMLRLMDGHDWPLGAFLDVEESGNMWFAPQAIDVVCGGLSDAGYRAGWYSGRSLANQYNLRQFDGRYLAWVAEYGDALSYNGTASAWQYTSSGSVAGIDGNVDVSEWYADFDGAENKEDDMSIEDLFDAKMWGDGADFTPDGKQEGEGGYSTIANIMYYLWQNSVQTKRQLEELSAQVSTLKAGGGTVDVDAIADAVADELHERMAE